jgi:acetyl-CoA decarbonylase/synthase complex subunit gamma
MLIDDIPRIASRWTWADHLGAWKVRWDMGRMSYAVKPGLYALGQPTPDSPVFASANYKLSFDYLRRALPGFDSWILVLDTKGINVWCAAGKGTFGTDELAARIKSSGLDKIVRHRQIIVPQLGGSGVAAHAVTRATGFKVIYGPVRADDIPEFLRAGLHAIPEMRLVRFNLKDRMSVVGADMAQGIGYLLAGMALAFLISGIGPHGYSSKHAAESGLLQAGLAALAFISGIILTPMLLPYIPVRAFAAKGFMVGMLAMAMVCCFVRAQLSFLDTMAWFLMTGAISSFLAMNFTGASTYTSLSGVVKEMKMAVPLQMAGMAIGFILWIIARFTA